LTRVEFIDALGQANVSAIQTSVEELKAEKEQAINGDSSLISTRNEVTASRFGLES